MRDRVVLGTTIGGLVAAALVWRALHPIAGMAVGVLAVLVACAAYRIEPPRIDLDGTPWLERDDAAAPPLERVDPVDQ